MRKSLVLLVGLDLKAVSSGTMVTERLFCSSTQQPGNTLKMLHRCAQMAPVLLHLLLQQVGNVWEPTLQPTTGKCIHVLLHQSAATASKQRVRRHPRFNALRSGWDKWRSCAKNAQCILGPHSSTNGIYTCICILVRRHSSVLEHPKTCL